MLSEKEIVQLLKDRESHYILQLDKATVFENVAVALMQCGLEHEVRILKLILELNNRRLTNEKAN